MNEFYRHVEVPKDLYVNKNNQSITTRRLVPSCLRVNRLISASDCEQSTESEKQLIGDLLLYRYAHSNVQRTVQKGSYFTAPDLCRNGV